MSESESNEEKENEMVFCNRCKKLISDPDQFENESDSEEEPAKPNTEPLESLGKIIQKPKFMQMQSMELPTVKTFVSQVVQTKIVSVHSDELQYDTSNLSPTKQKYFSFDEQTNKILNLIDPLVVQPALAESKL